MVETNWKNWAKGILWIVLYIVVYQVLMYASTGVVIGLAQVLGHESFDDVMDHIGNYANYFIISFVVYNIAIFYIFIKAKWAKVNLGYCRSSQNRITLLCLALFALCMVLPEIYAHELIDFDGLTKSSENLVENIMKNPLGLIIVGILGPIAEELLFRGAILKTLLRLGGDKYHWWAILATALLFGLIHGNVSQFVSAVWAGVVYGWLCYRTKSLVPSIVAHCVGNSAPCIFASIFPEMEKLVDIFHGNMLVMGCVLSVLFCISVASLVVAVVRIKRA